MNSKDVVKIRDFTLKSYHKLSPGFRLEDGTVLNHADCLAIAYYQGTVDLLISKGLLKDDDVLKFNLIQPSSTPPESDYE